MASYETLVISAVIILVCIAIAVCFVIYNKLKESKKKDDGGNEKP